MAWRERSAERHGTGMVPLPGNPGAVVSALGITGLRYGAGSNRGAALTRSQPTVEAVAS